MGDYGREQSGLEAHKIGQRQAGQALLAAHLLAIQTTIEKAKPLKPDRELNWIKDWLEAKYHPSELDSSIDKSYLGQYDKF